MISIRVWNVESDHTTKAVQLIEDEFLTSRQLGHLAIRSAGRSAFRKCHRNGVPLDDSLKKAIQHYLTQDDYIVIVSDSTNQKLENQKLVDHIKHVVIGCDFADKIYFAPDIQDSASLVKTEWRSFVSEFHTKVENDRQQFKKEWDRTVEHFHDAFADTPEEEVIRDFEEALAEVRRERS